MIDEGLPEVWPPAAIKAVGAFRQGDLVERPPFFYAANGACPIWSLTVGIADDGGDANIPVLADEDAPPYGIITTQSCDLTEQPPAGRRRRPCRPWFQIAPVSPEDRFTKEQVKGALKGGGFLYLVPLRPPELDGLWLADLRIEMPVEKGWLVERTPIHGFGDLAGSRDFSLRLQHLRSRVASEGGVTDHMLEHLKEFLARDAARGKSALEPVSYIMYEEHGAERSPSLLTLHVFPFEGDLPDHARELFDDWYDECVGVCRAGGCALQPPEYEARVSPRLFSQLIPVDTADLTPEEDTA
jgi:hypothetical protein